MNNTYNYEQNYERTQYEKIALQFIKGEQVQAKYIRSFDPVDNGNRLVEALPPMRSEEECANDFRQVPYWVPEVRQKSVRERLQLCSHISDFRVPRDFTCDVDFEVRNMLIRCYRARILNECPGSNGPGFYATTEEVVPGALFIGNSGTGKTTAISHALRYYPQLIVHETKDSRMLQIPYINVVCPPDASVKGFYDLCLWEVERITGYPITERYMRSTADTKAQIFRHQAMRFNIGLIVVDEVQNIMNVQKKTLMQHFLNLSNELNIPFLFVGTSKVKDFFEKEEFYIKRRTGSLLKASEFAKDVIWEHFLQSLWSYQWMREEISFSQEFSDVFFEETAGNIDRVKELFLAAQIEAIKTGFDTRADFTPQFIKQTSHKYFEISYDELNKKVKNETASQRLLEIHSSYHKKEETRDLLLKVSGKKEKVEQIKWRVIENIGIFSNGIYDLKSIESMFAIITKGKDISEIDESRITMDVLRGLILGESSKKQGTKKQKKEIQRKLVAENFPMFQGIGD